MTNTLICDQCHKKIDHVDYLYKMTDTGRVYFDGEEMQDENIFDHEEYHCPECGAEQDIEKNSNGAVIRITGKNYLTNK